ncbi:hypothetical protein LGT39_06440, partial [Demequina sp. TTPB684]
MDNNTSFSERDIDALVAGRVPRDPALAPLHGVLGSMKATLVLEPDPAHVSAFAAQLASVAVASASGAVAPEARFAPRTHARGAWRRRLSAAIAVSAVSGLGLAGAAAANEAAPGDLLYGVDQALESVGLLDGGTSERLDEAQVLLDEGSVDEALEHVVSALEDAGDDDSATALHRAALSVASQSSGDDVRAQVATMLQWMAGEETRGKEFGAAVSEFARTIAGKAPEVPGNNGTAPETPGNNG